MKIECVRVSCRSECTCVIYKGEYTCTAFVYRVKKSDTSVLTILKDKIIFIPSQNRLTIESS